MKKFLLATCAALLLSFGLYFSSSPLFTSTAQAKELEYSIYLSPGETYQLPTGTKYKYYSFPDDGENFTVSKKGLITIKQNPYSDGLVGEVGVVDQYGNGIATVEIYIVY